VEKISRVLDIGCGRGAFLEFLPFKEKYGVDISRSAVNEAKKRGIDARVVDIETEKLPYESNFFDIIFCMEILEHLLDASILFSEVRRVLKPGGYFYITVPNQLFILVNRMSILTGKYNLLDKDPYHARHIRFFKKSVLRDLVSSKGFKIVYVGGLPFRFRGRSLGVLGEVLANRFTDALVDYTLLARKPK
ncbi:MAG: methyltransferase domain-containing protein, partial [Candidatus Hadarchaeota archaeon]